MSDAYKLRGTVDLRGRSTQIVSRDQAGNSALTSIINYWLLTNPEFSIDNSVRFDGSYIKKVITRRIIDTMRANKDNLDLCHSLVKMVISADSILLNPMLSSIKEFQQNLQYELFSKLKIPVLHTGGTLSHQSLSSLRSEIEKEAVQLLYWNDNFFTICKYKGTIMILIDDNDVLVAHPKAVWKMLMMGDENITYVDGKFSLVCRAEGICSNCTLEFHSIINKRRHCQVHLPAFKAEEGSAWNEDALKKLWDEISSKDAEDVLSDGNSNVKKRLGSSVSEAVTTWVLSSGFRLTPTDVSSAAKHLKHLLDSNIKPSSDELLGILKIASEGTFMCTNLVQKEKSLDAMLATTTTDDSFRNVLGCFSLIIEHEMAKTWRHRMDIMADKVSSELLQQESSKEIHALKNKNVIEETECSDESLNVIEETECSDESLTASKSSSNPQDDVLHKGNVLKKLLPSDIWHWPQLNGQQYFPQFAARNSLIMTYILFSGKRSSVLTRIGRKAARKLLKFILRAHKAGKCWNGDWEVADIRVREDDEFLIAKEAEHTATKNGITADLQKFIEELGPYYGDENNGEPPFFHQFHSDSKNVPDLDSENFGLFLKFMRYHLAFMPPLARLDLFCKLFWVCELLRGKNDRGYKPLCAKACPGWRQKARAKLPNHGVYFFGIDPNDANAPEPYDMNYWELLKFVWSYVNHAHKHTMVDGVQMVKDIIEFDLMLSEDFAVHLSNMILIMMYMSKMEGQFASTWDAFCRSDAQNEDEVNGEL